MPELSKDVFGDAMAKAFFLRESPLDHHVDHHNYMHQQPFFYGSSYSPVMYKPQHLERQKIPGMSAHPSLSLPDPDAFLRHASSFLQLPSELESCHQQQQHQQQHQQQQDEHHQLQQHHHHVQQQDQHEQEQGQHHQLQQHQHQVQQQQQHQPQQQQSVSGFSPYALPHYQPLQLEVPEIEECSTWMSDVLDDFPAISTPELPPLVSTASFDEIPAPDFSCPVSLPPISLRVPLSCFEDDSTAPPPQPTTPPTTVKSSPGVSVSSLVSSLVSSPKSSTLDDVSSLSPTPKPLKPRASSRRSQRALEKPKKVTNIEQLEHVRRERQRRDDMSFKISTLECLLPPAGPNLKRDRASIVHDSVHYVKSLQEKVEELKKTLGDLKLKKSSRSDAVKVGNPELASSSSKSHLVEYHIQVEGEGEATARLEKCRCRPDFMSSAMKVLERLNLDVCRCTITKMFDYTICVIIVKPRLTSNEVPTSASVVSALRSSLQLY